MQSDVRFRNDNGAFFGYCEEATCGTNFASSINTYERTRNGRAARLDLNMQHAGESKWRENLKTALVYVSGPKWDGSTNITPERHISNCRQAYMNLDGASEHIDYQLPNERMKVKNLLDSVDECQNPKVCAAVLDISNIVHGTSTEFDKAAVFLLPEDPVTKVLIKERMLLSMRLQRPRVVLAPVGSAFVGTQIKSMEP